MCSGYLPVFFSSQLTMNAKSKSIVHQLEEALAAKVFLFKRPCTVFRILEGENALAYFIMAQMNTYKL